MARFILDGVFSGTIRQVGETVGGSCLPLAGGLVVAVFAAGLFFLDASTYIKHNMLDSDQCSASEAAPRQVASHSSLIEINGCEAVELSGQAGKRRLFIRDWNGLFDRQQSIDWGQGNHSDIVLATGQEIPYRDAGNTAPFFNDGGNDQIFAVTRPDPNSAIEAVKLFDIVVSPDGATTTIRPDPAGFARYRLRRVVLEGSR